MRRVILMGAWFISVVSAWAETPALLEAAVARYAADAERWAYTQEVIGKDRKGKVSEEKLVRYDPSLPYEEQWTLLKIDGKAPTERQVKKYRKEQEKRREKRQSLGEILKFEEATVLSETEQAVTFEIPLRKDGNQRLPPEKFLVTARVNKASQAFENIAVRVRESLRVAVVAKVKSGAVDLNFATVDPQHAPAITSLNADAEASILFVKVGGNYVMKRSEFKRVTPYSERFKVRIAPMQFLDF